MNKSVTSVNESEEKDEEEKLFLSYAEKENRTNIIVKKKTSFSALSKRSELLADLVDKWDSGYEEQQEIEGLINFGKYIRNLRSEKNLTRHELSKLSVLDKETLFLLESGLLPVVEVENALGDIALHLDMAKEELEKYLYRLSEKEQGPL